MTIRIGIIGPVGGATPSSPPGKGGRDALGRALEQLLDDPEIHQIIYLGLDDAATAAVEAQQRDALSEEAFLDRAAKLAHGGTPSAIDALLAEDEKRRRLAIVRRLPHPPARAIEMFERWILLAVHDKAMLDKDDVANAQVILYGKAKHADFKRFGPRCFFTPGPVSAGLVGRLELSAAGDLTLQAYDRHGRMEIDETLEAGSAKLVVTA
ncbi:MAG: hypothetical protein OXU20_00950 [Myxococcales bacterium]|nr:hypothetical protein [Myxococcales bacterium]MDD9965589.1 hypothetical protein [Myxococcales bacterium]